MNAKRWEIIDEEFISYTGGTAQLISNGECKVHLWETPKNAQLFCDKLNKLHEDINDLSVIAMRYKALEKENEQLKSLNIPIEEIKETVVDYKGRIVGVYYND